MRHLSNSRLVVLVLLAGGCSSKSSSSGSGASVLPGLPGYTVAVWAAGTVDYSNPDSIDTDGAHVFVGYQNVTSKTGGDGKSSTIVEYSLDGATVINKFSVPGHCDGMRVDPVSKKIWASSNEDGNPGLVSIDPATGTVTPYTLAPTVHGGGYDDIFFVGGKMLMVASAPVNLDSSGVNVNPALVSVTTSGGAATVAPALMGNAAATDTLNPTNAAAPLNLLDPDSLSAVYTQTPDDSGVGGVVGLLDLAGAKASVGYAIIKPVVIGFGKPTGMLFLKL